MVGIQRNRGMTVVNSWNEWDPLEHVIVGVASGTMVQAPEPAVRRDWPEHGFPLGTYGLYPKEMQENYKIFAVKCVKCHTLARPINTDKTAQEWKMYVKRMMNKPDSGISPSTGKRIYRFLEFRQAHKDKLRFSKD